MVDEYTKQTCKKKTEQIVSPIAQYLAWVEKSKITVSLNDFGLNFVGF